MVGSTTRQRVWVGVVAVIAASVGCTIKGDDPLFAEQDQGPAATDTDSTCEIPFPDEVQELFQNSCSGGSCHIGGQTAGGLNLDPANAVGNLVGQSNLANNAVRVVPGDADNSYLIGKIDGSLQPRMPLGGDPLTDAQITTLRDWVADVPDCSSVVDRDVVDSDVVDTDTMLEDAGVPDAGPMMDAEPVMVDPVPQAVSAIFQASCAGGGCHTDGGQSGGLALDADVAAQNLVNVDSNAAPGVLRVKPKDPDNSVLIQKLGDNPPGLAMPLAADPLSAADKQTIIDWINTLDDTVVTPMDDTVGGDTDEPDTDEPDTVTPECEPKHDTYEVSYGDIVAIFQTSCGGGSCHLGGQTSGGMALDTDVFLANTVGIKAQASALLRITPGDPDESYLLQKLTGDATPQMPLGGAPLSEQQITDITSWIEDCARDTAEQGVSTGK